MKRVIPHFQISFAQTPIVLTADRANSRLPRFRLMVDITKARPSAKRTTGTEEIHSKIESKADKFS